MVDTRSSGSFKARSEERNIEIFPESSRGRASYYHGDDGGETYDEVAVAVGNAAGARRIGGHRNRDYSQLLQMAHERAVSQQINQRPPFVSTGRRQSLFSNLKAGVYKTRCCRAGAREYGDAAVATSTTIRGKNFFNIAA